MPSGGEQDMEQGRLVYLTALCDSFVRRDEVMSAVWSAEDADEAVARVADLLGLSDRRIAHVLLDSQLRRWTRSAREGVTAERDELRVRLA